MKDSKKKILWVSHMVPYPPKAGLLNRSYNLIRELSDEYEVDLFCLVQENLITPYFDSFESGLRTAKRELSKFCSDVYFHSEIVKPSALSKIFKTSISLLGNKPYSTLWLKNDKFKNKITEAICFHEYDLVYVDSICLNDCIVVPEKSNSKLIMGHHNIESEMMKRRSERENNLVSKAIYYIEYLKLRRLEIRAFSLFDEQVVCSSADANLLKDNSCQSDPIVVPNGFDFNLLKNFDRNPDKNKLLFIGTMDWYPNIDAIRFFLKSVWPKLKLRNPQLEFDIVGSNPPSDLLELSRSDRSIRVHGFVDSLDPFLTNATLYICPIRDGGGTKLKLIEAFAHEIPCVVNKIACEGIDVGEQEVLFADTIDEYVYGIEVLLNNSEKAKNLARKAFDAAYLNYGYKAIVDSYKKTLKAIV